jgi:hypothetical protein
MAANIRVLAPLLRRCSDTMKPIKSLIILALVLAPAVASAQGYYGGSPSPYRERGGFHHRMGRIAFGGSLGLGFMNDNGNGLSCDSCDYSPAAAEADFHLGGFISPRFALLFEGQFNLQTISADNGNGDGNTYAVQSAFMVAGQYWLTPIFWVKGGIGVAHLSVQDDAGDEADVGTGLAVMGAAGVELISTRFWALDLQGRIISGNYDGTDDHITSGTVGVGFNWY